MGANTTPSEASRMLEAALEQMDGIIQGAKYEMEGAKFELPNYFDTFNIEDPPRPKETTKGSVNEALKNLKKVIATSPEDVSIDQDTQEFLYNWLQNNKVQSPQSWWKSDASTPAVHDLVGIEERMLQLERDKDSLQLQTTVLEDQLEGQAKKISSLEKQLQEKTDQCKKLEAAASKDRGGKSALESSLELKNGELKTEVANQKLKSARLQRDLEEFRNGTPKLQRPTHLGSLLTRSPTPVSSPEDESPTSRKGVVFSDQEENITEAADLDTSMISLSGRSTRGLKKILCKIKRSNSGGFEDRLNNGSQAGSEAPFVRGGMRATASGRLGWSGGTNLNRQKFTDWSVDTLCSWLETIGLGQYCGEVQRHIGTGKDLARLAANDMDTKLGIRHPLHRKKLVLAIQAKVDPNRPDPAGQLDCSWVVRWLDDVGLPQYKDTFLESRVDGRLLNLLTVDDLSYLKVSNLLHHYSLRRGIQVLRENSFDFDCMKRRAVPGELDGNVKTWSNHRVMEWLRQVDLAEYAPNLRGSGVHGGLMVIESRFNAELLGSVLSISHSRTLLRRHLNIHFTDLVGKDIVAEKRRLEMEAGYLPLTPSAKAKSRHGQFTLKRKKSKAEFDVEDSLLCPLSPVPGAPNKPMPPVQY